MAKEIKKLKLQKLNLHQQKEVIEKINEIIDIITEMIPYTMGLDIPTPQIVKETNKLIRNYDIRNRK